MFCLTYLYQIFSNYAFACKNSSKCQAAFAPVIMNGLTKPREDTVVIFVTL